MPNQTGWSSMQTTVPALWGAADVSQITTTRSCVVLHRKGCLPLYLERGLVEQAAGVSEGRQRAAIVRDRRIDFAILSFIMALLATALVVIAWLR